MSRATICPFHYIYDVAWQISVSTLVNVVVPWLPRVSPELLPLSERNGNTFVILFKDFSGKKRNVYSHGGLNTTGYNTIIPYKLSWSRLWPPFLWWASMRKETQLHHTGQRPGKDPALVVPLFPEYTRSVLCERGQHVAHQDAGWEWAQGCSPGYVCKEADLPNKISDNLDLCSLHCRNWYIHTTCH